MALHSTSCSHSGTLNSQLGDIGNSTAYQEVCDGRCLRYTLMSSGNGMHVPLPDSATDIAQLETMYSGSVKIMKLFQRNPFRISTTTCILEEITEENGSDGEDGGQKGPNQSYIVRKIPIPSKRALLES